MVTLLSLAALTALAGLFDTACGKNFHAHSLERRVRHDARASAAPSQNDTSSFRYLTNDTQPFRVESLPEVPFDVGELYAGLITINQTGNDSLFFIFQPTIGPPVDEVTIYLNGGPGWSSFESFFQEVGRFTWQPGTYQPVENPYSWVNLTNMLWVDQPIGTGYSPGIPVATTLEETSTNFVNFFENFETIFGIKNYKIFITGESYAGRYVPYIASAMLDKNDTTLFNVSGALLYDPCIGDWDFTQQEVPVVPFVRSNNNVMGFNASFLSQLEERHQSCGYADIISTYLTYPPPGNQPAVFFNSSAPSNSTCGLWEAFDHNAFAVNPCFDVYDVSSQCPLLWDVLAHRTQFDYIPAGTTPYPNRSDVKAALHVPESINWYLDQHFNVYVADDGDGGPEMAGETSLDPIQYTLPRLIEATNRVLVSNGDLDMIIITNGTLLAIQNMTWHNQLGFQSAPNQSLIVSTPDLEYQAVFAASHEKGRDLQPQGTVGIWHYERGLMWTETFLGTHTQPESQPRAALKHLEWVLGRINSF